MAAYHNERNAQMGPVTNCACLGGLVCSHRKAKQSNRMGRQERSPRGLVKDRPALTTPLLTILLTPPSVGHETSDLGPDPRGKPPSTTWTSIAGFVHEMVLV